MVGSVVATAFWAMLPAYVPNNVAVLAGGGRPIDAGATWNGKRLLGDGKTWRGTVAGTLAGVALAMILNTVVDPAGAAVGVDLPRFPFAAALGLALGAMVGDIAASFLKRRTGRERGAAFPGLDQLDFVVGGLVLSAAFATDWFLSTFTPGVVLAVLVITPVLHVGTNVLAYRLGLKDEPW
ncbi:MAG: CDP-2,3-bis-(O-geranylgeranyl)-sn-glycerol synthase [Haloferacaceae archaeon]